MTFAARKYEHALAVLRGQMRWHDAQQVEARFWTCFNSYADNGYAHDVAATKAVQECFPWLGI